MMGGEKGDNGARTGMMDEGQEGGKVRVAVRIRPLNGRERLAGSTQVVHTAGDGKQVVAAPDRLFTFDAAYASDAGQAQIFQELVQPMISDFVNGFNCTILAYGQTGSGKTYTMGTGMDGALDPLTKGIIPRALCHLYSLLGEIYGKQDMGMNNMSDTGGGTDGQFCEIYVSFIELYNEEIIDLLNPQSADRNGDRTKRPVLTIREDTQGSICIAGIREERVRDLGEISEYVERGMLCRTTKSTEMNLVSSRSHAIFTIILRQRRREGEEGNINYKSLVSKLHFVDLAGSERLKRTNAIGERAKESISINSGLLALGNVISALGDESRKATHVPYRDSKLTRLLQDSLGGNSRTLMISCISPSSDNYAETVNTLKYANRARNIKNRAMVNEDASGNAAFEIMQLKKQVAALKQEILQLRGAGILRRPIPQPSSGVSSNRQSITMTRTRGEEEVGIMAELERLRKENRELQRKTETITKERLNLEAERDFYKSAHLTRRPSAGPTNKEDSPREQMTIIREHLKTISDLRGRVAELDMQLRNARDGNKETNREKAAPLKRKSQGGPISKPITPSTTTVPIEPPSTPKWFNRASELIDRTKQEICNNLKLIADTKPEEPTGIMSIEEDRETTQQLPLPDIRAEWLNPERFAAAVNSRTEAILNQVQNDMNIKEELISQLEASQQEYLLMRHKYEERLQLMQSNIAAIERERDEALKVVLPREDLGRTARLKYEEQIKKMGKELNGMRDKVAELNKEASSRSTASDAQVRNLRSTVQNLKTERTRLAARVTELANTLQISGGGQEDELRELRQKERKASEQARKFKKAYEFQKSLLQKRIEQYLQTKNRLRILLSTLHKHRIPTSPSLEVLLESPSSKRRIQNYPPTASGFAESPSTSTTLGSRLPSALSTKLTSAADLQEAEEAEDGTSLDEQEEEQAEEVRSKSSINLADKYDHMSIDESCHFCARGSATPSNRQHRHHQPLASFGMELGEEADSTIEKHPFSIINNHDKGNKTGLSTPHSSRRSSRRNSLIEQDHPLVAPPGSEVPRSVLRMSPLIPRRRDMFARLADAASLSLASHHLQQQIQTWSNSGSGSGSASGSNSNLALNLTRAAGLETPGKTATGMNVDLKTGLASGFNISSMADLRSQVGASQTVGASPMKVDPIQEDIIEFYRNNVD